MNWPAGIPRTPPGKREKARFDPNLTEPQAIRDVEEQVRLMGATHLRIESDPTLYGADADPGVVVFFHWRGRDYAWPCDHWKKRAHNLRAIARTLEAKRGMERWKATSLEQEFERYAALPPGAHSRTVEEEVREAWEETKMGGDQYRSDEDVFRRLAKRFHSDRPGGSDEHMTALLALRQALREHERREKE